jgi:hypothetical protein
MAFQKGHLMSDEIRAKISSKLKGRIFSQETKQKISKAKTGKKRLMPPWNKGKKFPEKSGAFSHRWKGGITPINMQIRNSPESKLWRTAVFTRDNYTCIWCGRRGVTLHADHIKPFALFPELRFELSNGRTLCAPCHRKTDGNMPPIQTAEFRKLRKNKS